MASTEDSIRICVTECLPTTKNLRSVSRSAQPADLEQATAGKGFLALGVHPDVSGLLGCDLDGIQVGELADRHVCAPDQ